MNVLDLPIIEQEKIAIRYNMSLKEWQAHISKVLQETNSAFSDIQSKPDFDIQHSYRFSFTEMNNDKNINQVKENH